MRLIDKAYKISLDNFYNKDWTEVEGPESNPLIKKCYAAVDGLGNPEMQDDSVVSWCSAYMNYVIQAAGGNGTRSALARSWLNWGKSSSGKTGDIVVLKRGTLSWQGHVGQLVKKTMFFVYILGGNQNNDVNITRFPRALVIDYRTSLD